jgi:outer membrane protein OmpA-like peptidoglycan-associated protein
MNKSKHMTKITSSKKYSILIPTLLLSLFCTLPTFADNTTISADQLIEALSAPVTASIGMTRGFVPKANPDAVTRVCDADLNKQLIESTGQRGEQLTRNLYVEKSPSIDLDIAFQRGEVALLPAGKSQLDALAQAMTDPKLSAEKFVLAGHTDSDGGLEYNDRLSCERALSVRNYLRDQHKLDSNRLVPMGFGYLKLKDKTDPRSEVNRRVEIRRYSGLSEVH